MTDVQDDFPLLTSAGQLGIDLELKREIVVVPEWRTKVILQELSGAQLDRYNSGFVKYNARTSEMDYDITGSSVRLVVLSMVDPQGHPLHRNIEKGMEAVGKLPASGLDRVHKVAKRLNGIGTDDDSAQDSVGKSEEAPGTDSSEDSVSLLV